MGSPVDQPVSSGWALPSRSHFSLSLRTEAPAGLLFYVADQAGEDFMALVLDQGQLVFSFRSTAHRVQIRSQGAYNDGGWHSVRLPYVSCLWPSRATH